MKSWMMGLALLMGTSLTSCLNSDTEYTPQLAGIVKTTMYGTSFTLYDGKTTITPTSASLSSVESNMGFKAANSNISFIMGTYDETLNPEGTTDFASVNMTYGITLDAKVEMVGTRGADNDSVNAAPIISFENSQQTSGANFHSPWFFYDKTSLILPINYYFSKPIHKFTLVYYTNESNADECKLYLRQYIGDDKGNQYQSYSMSGGFPNLYFFAFDLSSVFYNHRNLHGENPSEITIEYLQNENSYDQTEGETKTITIPVKSLIETGTTN